jgi:hypothetical protein
MTSRRYRIVFDFLADALQRGAEPRADLPVAARLP